MTACYLIVVMLIVIWNMTFWEMNEEVDENDIGEAENIYIPETQRDRCGVDPKVHC